MMKRTVLALLLCALWMPLLAQNALPLRGKLAPRYPFLYNGTPMVDAAPPGNGTVFMDGHLYPDVRLHLNACSQDLVIYPDGYPPFRPPRERIAWFTKDSLLYVNARALGYDLPEGFYRVLHDGSAAVLLRTDKILLEDARDHNTEDDLGYVDPAYRKKVYRYFKIRNQLFLVQDSTAAPVTRKQRGFLSKLMQEEAAPSVILPRINSLQPPEEAPVADSEPVRTAADSLHTATGADTWSGTDPEHQLRSARISAARTDPHSTALQGMVRLQGRTLARVPTAFGEKDILRGILALPGVKTVGEASGGLNVRGGAADQNLVLLDGSTIYNHGHLFGILSGFNPDLVREVSLYKGSIPVSYGGRMSAVLDITGKDGNPERLHGSVALGLLTSRLSLDGPLGRNTTFIAGGRISYSDGLLDKIPANSAYRGGKAGFHDLHFRIRHRFDERNNLLLSVYHSFDRFSFTRDTSFRYSNSDVSLRWEHSMGTDTRLTVAAGYDDYRNRLKDTGQDYAAYELRTGVRQGWLKAGYRRERERHTLLAGMDATLFGVDGGHRSPFGEASFVPEETLPTEQALEAAIYAGDNIRIGSRWTADLGVRLTAFAGKDVFYPVPEVRVSGKYSPLENLSVKAGFGTMSQNIHVISNSTAISPMDTYKLSDPKHRPTTGYQASAGVYWTLREMGIDLSLESYYKRMKDYLDYRSGASLVMNPNLSEDLLPVRGKAWGVEVMANRSSGQLNGWVAYTWSRTLLQDPAKDIDGGDWYPAAYDRPHEFKAMLNYEFTRRFSFSAGLEYTSGRPVTVPIGYYRRAGAYRLVYSDRNGYRIPDYFRLDVAFNIDPGHYLKALAHTSVTLGCYNVTGRKNAYSVYYTTVGGKQLSSYLISVFPVPIPYVNINILF